MEELNPEWYTSGCIIHEGKAHLVTTHTALLIMQPRLYAEVQANAHERDLATATTESNRLLMVRVAHDLRRWATGDPAFLESPISLWQCSISVAVRAELGFLSVTKENFSDYIAEVMQHVLPARRAIPPTFLLNADPDQPELFVIQASAHLAQFAGGWIYTQVVSNADLTRLYNRVAEDFPAEKRRSSEEEFNRNLLDSLESGVPHPNIKFGESLPLPTPRLKRSSPKNRGSGSGKEKT